VSAEDFVKRFASSILLPQFLGLRNREWRLKLQLAYWRMIRKWREKSESDAVCITHDNLIRHSAEGLAGASVDRYLIHGLFLKKAAKSG
jgi:hypothetical protein